MTLHHSLVKDGWNVAVYGGSTVALVAGGVLAIVRAVWLGLTAVIVEHEPITTIGVITALTGAITAVTALIGGHVVPILRTWLATVHAERIAKIQRHNLATRVQQLTFEKDEIQQRLEASEKRLEASEKRLEATERRLNSTEANLARALVLAAQNRREISDAKVVIDQKMTEIKHDVRAITDSGTHRAVDSAPPEHLP